MIGMGFRPHSSADSEGVHPSPGPGVRKGHSRTTPTSMVGALSLQLARCGVHRVGRLRMTASQWSPIGLTSVTAPTPSPWARSRSSSGLEYARFHHDTTERRLALQTTLRTGLTDRLEVRLDSEPLVRCRGRPGRRGPGGPALGVKARVFEPAEG